MATAGRLTFDQFLTLRGKDRRLARLTHDVPMPAGQGLLFGELPLACGHLVDVVGIGIPPRSSYDFAIAPNGLGNKPDLLGWLSNVHDVLRPGGVFNLVLPHCNSPGQDDQCPSFTPHSFLDFAERSCRLRAFGFVFNQVSPPEHGEFFVSMRRDRETDETALLAKQLGAITYLRERAESWIVR